MSKQNPNNSNLNVTPDGEVIVDYFRWMDKAKDQPRKEKLNYLAGLINHYRQIEFIDQYSNGGFENMNDAVYWLLGLGEYVDNIMDYRFTVQNLLRLLATPRVMDIIRTESPTFDGTTATMLDRLLDFLIKLDGPAHRTMLQLHDMLHHPPESDEEIEPLIIEYEERIRSSASGKVKNIY